MSKTTAAGVATVLASLLVGLWGACSKLPPTPAPGPAPKPAPSVAADAPADCPPSVVVNGGTNEIIVGKRKHKPTPNPSPAPGPTPKPDPLPPAPPQTVRPSYAYLVLAGGAGHPTYAESSLRLDADVLSAMKAAGVAWITMQADEAIVSTLGLDKATAGKTLPAVVWTDKTGKLIGVTQSAAKASVLSDLSAMTGKGVTLRPALAPLESLGLPPVR